MLTRRDADVLRLRECAYCGQLPAGGIDRLAAAGEYNVENCVPCCRACNIAKKDRPPWHFVLSCRAVVEFRRNGRASGWTTAVMLRSQTRYKDWLSDARNRRQIEVGISRAQFETLTQQPCVFCGLEQCGGVDRRDASGVYDVENCQPACKVCNFAKNNVSDAAFIALCERVVRRFEERAWSLTVPVRDDSEDDWVLYYDGTRSEKDARAMARQLAGGELLGEELVGTVTNWAEGSGLVTLFGQLYEVPERGDDAAVHGWTLCPECEHRFETHGRVVCEDCWMRAASALSEKQRKKRDEGV